MTFCGFVLSVTNTANQTVRMIKTSSKNPLSQFDCLAVGSYRQQCFRVSYLVYCLPFCESFSHTLDLFKPSFVRALVCVCCYYSRFSLVIDVLPFICIPGVCGMLTYLSLPTCQPSCRRPFSASLPKAQTPSILRLFRLLHPQQSFQLTCPCSSPHCVHANPWLCIDECM